MVPDLMGVEGPSPATTSKRYRSPREEEALSQLLDESAAQRIHREQVQKHTETVNAEIRRDLKQIFTTAPKFGRSANYMQKAFTARKWDDEFSEYAPKGPRGSKGWFTKTNHKLFNETLGRDPSSMQTQRARVIRRSNDRIQRSSAEEKDKEVRRRRQMERLKVHHRQAAEVKRLAKEEEERVRRAEEQRAAELKESRDTKWREAQMAELVEWQQQTDEVKRAKRAKKQARERREVEECRRRAREWQDKKQAMDEEARRQAMQGRDVHALEMGQKLKRFIAMKRDMETKALQHEVRERNKQERIHRQMLEKEALDNMKKQGQQVRAEEDAMERELKEFLERKHQRKVQLVAQVKQDQAHSLEQQRKWKREHEARAREHAMAHHKTMLGDLTWQFKREGGQAELNKAFEEIGISPQEAC